MKQYKIEQGLFAGVIESDELLTNCTRSAVADESKQYAWAGNRWVEIEQSSIDKKEACVKKESSRLRFKEEYNMSILENKVEINGFIFQARDTDLPKLQFAIAMAVDGVAVIRLENNIPTSMPVATVEAAIALGIDKVKVINDTYNAGLASIGFVE